MAISIIPISKPFKWLSRKSRASKASKSSISSPASPMNPTKHDDFRHVFAFFDHDGDGKISASELVDYFSSIGESSVSHEEAERAISEFDTDGDNLIDFGDFVRFVEQRDENGNVMNDDLRRAFEMFEVDGECGCITPRGLQAVLNRLGGEKSVEECEAMIRAFDLDGNGVIDFQEFHKMMMN